MFSGLEEGRCGKKQAVMGGCARYTRREGGNMREGMQEEMYTKKYDHFDDDDGDASPAQL